MTGRPAAAEPAAALPTEAATLERAHRLVTEAMYSVALQRRRLRTEEPEDEVFPMRSWADWEFFIIALWRLRRRAQIAARTSAGRAEVASAIGVFDRELPDLKLLRDVAEHIDEYALDHPKRHRPVVRRTGLQVGAWDGTRLSWHLRGDEAGRSCELDADLALAAAQRLCVTVSRAQLR